MWICCEVRDLETTSRIVRMNYEHEHYLQINCGNFKSLFKNLFVFGWGTAPPRPCEIIYLIYLQHDELRDYYKFLITFSDLYALQFSLFQEHLIHASA